MAVVAVVDFRTRSVPIKIVDSGRGRFDRGAAEYPNAFPAYARRVLSALRHIAAGARKGT
jgi:hypothetical protein